MSTSVKSETLNSSHELSASSSNETVQPMAFTGQPQKDGFRRGSTASGKSYESTRSLGYSEKDIYCDLDSEEIRIQRELTRKTILSELEQKAQNEAFDFPNLPESAVPVDNAGEEFADIDPELVTWDGYDDPEDPRNWSIATKLYLIAFVSLYTVVSPMSSSMPSPAVEHISKDFGITSNVVQAMMISIQILAWAMGPLIIAPLSENDLFGRKVVLDVSIWMSLFFNIGCAFSQNTAQMMVFRFVGGLFGSSPINVGAGVISDLFEAKQRTTALAGFSLAPLLGPVIAPVIAGFIVDHKDWRWVFYILCIFNGAVAIVGTIFYRETYSPTLLKQKARRLRKETGNKNLHTIYEIADGETFLSKVMLTMTRPVMLLFTHPMIIGLGSFMAFTYGFMYLMIVTFPEIFKVKYGFSLSITGLMYIPMGVGFMLGVVVWTLLINKTYTRLCEKNGGEQKPEYRLPCLFATSIIIPIGLVWYGWSAQYKLHRVMPGFGSAIFSFGLVGVFQSLQGYLIDMNPRFAASSVAAAALFRSLFGFAFPLFASKMYARLNYGWGNTMCAFIGLVLGVPFPIFCYIYGERVRLWANQRMEQSQAKRDQKNLQRLKRKLKQQ